MTDTYKVTYFNARGLAEATRLVFAYAGIKYEDERITKEEWPQRKGTTPFGTIPLLTVNGQEYHQSIAILRFSAKKAGLIGRSDIENMEIDMMADTVNELRLKFLAMFHEEDEEVKAAKTKAIKEEHAPFYLTRLEKIAKENNGHLACKRLTWADFYFAALIAQIFNYVFGPKWMFQYPNLAKVEKNVVNIPSVQEWIERRPKTEF